MALLQTCVAMSVKQLQITFKNLPCMASLAKLLQNKLLSCCMASESHC